MIALNFNLAVFKSSTGAALTFFSLFLRVLFSGLDEPEFRPDELLGLLEKLLIQQMHGIVGRKA